MAKQIKSIKAVADKIVVERIILEKSEGGLYLMKPKGETTAIGTVLSVGEEVKGIDVGDVVAYNSRGGNGFDLDDGRELMCMMYNTVYGVVETVEKKYDGPGQES